MNRLLGSKKEILLGGLPHFFGKYLPNLSANDCEKLLQLAEDNLSRNGNLVTYVSLLSGLPRIEGVELSENGEIAFESSTNVIDEKDFKKIENAISRLVPWRKGPFKFFGHKVDAEWNSALKWGRLSKEIECLRGRLVLDVGSGNGYFALRMALAEAKAVLCLEPSLQSFMQFRFCKHFLSNQPLEMLPLRSEQVQLEEGIFDTVFSMGVLYHNRRPKIHLKDLRRYLRFGGQLILETIINSSSKASILVPSGRYASMRNVWSVPSRKMVEDWLWQSGFDEPRCIDVSTTTIAEQRRTEMMPYHSLTDGLDDSNNDLTVEGYERPMRGLFVASAAKENR